MNSETKTQPDKTKANDAEAQTADSTKVEKNTAAAARRSWREAFVRFRLQLRGQAHRFGLSRSMRVWIVMSLLSLALIIGGYTLQTRNGLLAGFFLAISLNSLVLFYSDIRLFSLFAAKELEGRDAFGILRTTRELSHALGMRRPQVHWIESNCVIAFSAGLLPSRTSIFISSGLVQKLTAEEVRAVIALELVRIKEEHTASATAASALAGVIAITAEQLDRLITLQFFKRNRKSEEADHRAPASLSLGPFGYLLSPLSALIVRASVLRRDYWSTDQAAASLIGDRESLARALWKLASYAHTRPYRFCLAEAHLFTVSPLDGRSNFHFVSAQPTAKSRVLALAAHYPGG